MRISLTRRQPQKWRSSTILCLLLVAALSSFAFLATVALVSLDGRHHHGREGPAAAAAAASLARVAAPGDATAGSFASATATADVIPPPRATIAYAVSLTSCGAAADRHDNVRNGGHSSDPSFHEGAAILKHSIHLASVRNHRRSRSLFDYEMIAFVHPGAASCSQVFRDLGYTVQIRETPFNVTDIQETFLREHIVKSGCCGEKEYLKLYAYTLLDYPIVVHLDLDSLVLRPMDDLFLAMLGTGDDDVVAGARSRVPVMHDAPLPSDVRAYFTRDYNMVQPGHRHPGVQGGFLVVRPDLAAFREYVATVLEGKFFQGSGWQGKGYGGYFGAQQIQGICSFYYDYKHPGTGVELNKCYYNAMADAPRHPDNKKCRDGHEQCQDCRDTPLEEIKSVHFTLCSKPWKCPGITVGERDSAQRICTKFHQEWFRIREDYDRARAAREGMEYKRPQGTFKPEVYRGYCKSNGERGYIPIKG